MKIQIVYKKFRTHITKYKTLTSNNHYFNGTVVLFLEKEWGWKIKYNEKDKVIIADENKDICVCPLISNFSNSDLSFICHCSESFAELIFSHVLGNPVSATVVSSILRGYKSCSYRIDI